MKRSLRCPRCEGSMTEGFIMDEAHGRWRVSRWQSGRPVKSIWTGIKQSRANQLPVSSWRCDRCGFLESYATAG